jgi:SHS2 domain-containing protein
MRVPARIYATQKLLGEGEVLDPMRHDQVVDVKAVTLHRFQVARSPEGWKAFVILDI